MTDPSNETSKTLRHRSLRFKNQSKTSTDYELPSLRAKPRQKQPNGNTSDNDSDTGDTNDSEHDELSDSPSEDSDIEEDSDDGSVFSMDEVDEVDDLDNEEELANPTRSRDRQRRRPQHDILAGSNANSSKSSTRKRRLDNDDGNPKTPKVNDNRVEQATSSNGSPNNHQHPKRRKLRPSHTIRSTTIYNDLLSDDSEWLDQDIGIQYPSDMDIVMNDRRRKSTTTSPLVLGSPSKVVKTLGDGERKQQRQQLGDIDNSATLLSPDRIDHSRQSSSSSSSKTHGASPLSNLDEKKWPRRPQASAFLDKLQAKEMDTLDLSQHSFIPDDFLESQHQTATTTTTTTGSRGARAGKQTTLIAKNNGGSDDVSDSDDMAYQYDFSTISEPSSMAINPTTSDTILDDQGDTHTHQISTNPPTPTPTPNTTQDEPRQPPSLFRRITRFFFG